MSDRRIHATVVAVLYTLFGSNVIAQEPRLGAGPRLEAWTMHQKMANDSPFRELPWQRLGPKFAGGRIESIDAPRGSTGTIYAGVGAGGVWKTINGGLTWKPIFEQEATFAIGDLTVAPSNENTIWIGTGECHLSGTSYTGVGVYKSSDAGETWTNMGLHETGHIGKVVIDPTDENIVYVAAMGRGDSGDERGVYKTSDGGKTFQQVLETEGRSAIVDLVIDPNDPSRLFAAAWGRGRGQQSGVYRSDDAGETWKRLEEGLLTENVGRVAIDVAPSKPGVVYALMVDHSRPEARRRDPGSLLFRSDDYGDTWIRTHEKVVPTYVGWDFCDVRVSSDNADEVYVGGLRLIVSRDGGKTFEGEGGFAPNRSREDVFRLHAHAGMGMHLDVHDIWVDPENAERIMLGNDGGLFVSWDRGRTWLHLNNLPIAEFYKIHLDNEEPFQIWGGTQDNASFVGPSTARVRTGEDDDWRYVFLDPWTGGDGFATFPDPNDPRTVFYTQQQGDLKRTTLGRLRADKRIKPRARRGEEELRWSWDTPFFASQHEGETVLYCAAQRVMKSTDRGDSWDAISPDLSNRGLITLSESPIDPQRLAAGGGRGKVHVTDDGGENWTAVGDGLPNKEVRDVVMSAHDAKRLFVAFSGESGNDSASYLYVSNDFGETWQPIGEGLPHEPVNCIAEDAKTDGLLFVGTDLGVYTSMNAGEEWISLCATFPSAPVVDLELQDRDGALVAATHGLSLFLLQIEAIRREARKLKEDEN